MDNINFITHGLFDGKYIKGALEALLFACGDAMDVEKLASAVGISEDDTEFYLGELINEYNVGKGIEIIRLENKFQMRTNPMFYEPVNALMRLPEKKNLSPTLLETLAIIAFKQPITKPAIEEIRGLSAEHAVKSLVDLGLIQECGRQDTPGRPILFETTEEFLRRFGVESLAAFTDPGLSSQIICEPALIRTKNLTIREFNLDDTPQYFLNNQDEQIKAYMSDHSHISEDDAREEIKSFIDNYDSLRMPCHFAIVRTDTNTLIGHIGIGEADLKGIGKAYEICYAINKDFRGRSYATEAVQAFMVWCKNTHDITNVYASVNQENNASHKTLLKAGFNVTDTEFENQKPNRIVYCLGTTYRN
ncbi:MAG: SMC-Scp complex subunit ScpB [Defluviitaleaceae bacterium]|nr:SMC-Scp complex subunit ScpB [Defluviitaleaceae bacterium]